METTENTESLTKPIGQEVNTLMGKFLFKFNVPDNIIYALQRAVDDVYYNNQIKPLIEALLAKEKELTEANAKLFANAVTETRWRTDRAFLELNKSILFETKYKVICWGSLVKDNPIDDVYFVDLFSGGTYDKEDVIRWIYVDDIKRLSTIE